MTMPDPPSDEPVDRSQMSEVVVNPDDGEDLSSYAANVSSGELMTVQPGDYEWNTPRIDLPSDSGFRGAPDADDDVNIWLPHEWGFDGSDSDGILTNVEGSNVIVENLHLRSEGRTSPTFRFVPSGGVLAHNLIDHAPGIQDENISADAYFLTSGGSGSHIMIDRCVQHQRGNISYTNNGQMFCWCSSSGELTVRRCKASGLGDNVVYSRMSGPMTVENCVFGNTTPSCVRLGGNNEVVRNCTFYADQDNYELYTGSGDVSLNAVMADNMESASDGGRIENCSFIAESGNAIGMIRIFSNDYIEVEDCQFLLNGGIDGIGVQSGSEVVLDNVDFHTETNSGLTAGRSGVTYYESNVGVHDGLSSGSISPSHSDTSFDHDRAHDIPDPTTEEAFYPVDDEPESDPDPDPDDAYFDVEITGTNSPVETGDFIEVEYEVTNTGEGSGTQDVTLELQAEGEEDIIDVDTFRFGINSEWDNSEYYERIEDGDAVAGYAARRLEENRPLGAYPGVYEHSFEPGDYFVDFTVKDLDDNSFQFLFGGNDHFFDSTEGYHLRLDWDTQEARIGRWDGSNWSNLTSSTLNLPADEYVQVVGWRDHNNNVNFDIHNRDGNHIDSIGYNLDHTADGYWALNPHAEDTTMRLGHIRFHEYHPHTGERYTEELDEPDDPDPDPEPDEPFDVIESFSTGSFDNNWDNSDAWEIYTDATAPDGYAGAMQHDFLSLIDDEHFTHGDDWVSTSIYIDSENENWGGFFFPAADEYAGESEVFLYVDAAASENLQLGYYDTSGAWHTEDTANTGLPTDQYNNLVLYTRDGTIHGELYNPDWNLGGTVSMSMPSFVDTNDPDVSIWPNEASGNMLIGDYRVWDEDPMDYDPDDVGVEPGDYGNFMSTADVTDEVLVGEGGNWYDKINQFAQDGESGPDGNYHRVHYTLGGTNEYYGMSAKYYHHQNHANSYSDVEAAHARWWLYIPEDFEFADSQFSLDGTKIGGWGASHEVFDDHLAGGYGGRDGGGSRGWTDRMIIMHPDYTDYATTGQVGVGSQIYGYQNDEHGDVPRWTVPLERGQWHQIDQYVNCNYDGNYNGFHKGWIDGELALDYDGAYMRHSDYEDTIGIKDFWFNFFFGGEWGTPINQSLWFGDFEMWAWYDAETADNEYPHGDDDTVPEGSL